MRYMKDEMSNPDALLQDKMGRIERGEAGFWDFLRVVKTYNFCYNSRCTTCGAMFVRKAARSLSDEAFHRMINDVTFEEIQTQRDFDWHDFLDTIFETHASAVYKDTLLYREYKWIWNEFNRLHYREHVHYWDAKQAVFNELQERGKEQ